MSIDLMINFVFVPSSIPEFLLRFLYISYGEVKSIKKELNIQHELDGMKSIEFNPLKEVNFKTLRVGSGHKVNLSVVRYEHLFMQFENISSLINIQI